MYVGLFPTAVFASSIQMKKRSSTSLRIERSNAVLETLSVPAALVANPMATIEQLL